MSRRTRRTAALVAAATGLAVVASSAPAFAASGWTQLSQTSSATTYPRIGNIAQPTAAWFGDTLQVVWEQQDSASADSYVTAVVNGAGDIVTGATPMWTWQTLTENPSLVSVGGQHFLGFSGLNPGRSGAQYFATAPDATSWTVSNGSMSETQSAYAAYGSDVIDNAGTPVWVGNAGSTTGIRWHVGTSDANPAPAGSDQSYNLSGCCAYDAAAARDEATGVVYAAFYSNASATTENGIQVGQILPASAGWHQAPGSVDITDGRAASLDPSQRIAMVGRPGGGVYIAYVMGYPTAKMIRILNVGTGATLDVPGSKDAQHVALSAEPDGRLWVTWHVGTRAFAVHTNAAVTRLGSIGSWGAPAGSEYLWKSEIAGTSGGASLVYTATTQNAINVWHRLVHRTLTVKAAPATVRRNAPVKVLVTDAGDPVAGAKVKIGGRMGTTNASGKVTLNAPSSRGSAKVVASKAAYNPGVTRIRVR
ncbi:MAG: hypothetical protein GC156_02450 [Actinomycetales bacterium]|nr:hypothetical protein [Actinomycetales bacterium]